MQGEYRRKRKKLAVALDELDRKCECVGLCASDRDLQLKMKAELKTLIREEELKRIQRSKEIDLLEGDNNTKYYHAKANGRRRKTSIIRLMQDEGVIEGQQQLMNYITDFYKGLFGRPDNSTISLNGDGITKLSEADGEILTRNFSLKELEEAVFGMAANKASGPDGFNVEFYQKNWELVKNDLFGLLVDFHNGVLDVSRINYGVITLVPKGKDADRIQKYRPVCLLNITLKILTKVLVNRLNRVIQTVIRPTQTAFIKGKYIMEGVCVLHEVLNDLHTKKRQVCFSK